MTTSDTVPDALALYLTELEAFPLLSEQEECELATAAMQGSATAKRRLIEHNLRLVVNIAKHYQYMGLDIEDLVSEGNAGLMRAVETFDPAKGRLTTYATWWIKQSIRRALEKTGRLIRLPSYQHSRLAYLAQIRAHLAEAYGEEPSVEHVAQASGFASETVLSLLLIDQGMLSLDQPVSSHDDTPLAHFIPDRNTPASDAHLLAEEIQSMLAAQVAALLTCLTEREQHVIRLRFGFDGRPAQTLSQIGRRLGLSKERVRQVLVTAFGKLYHQCLCSPSSLTLNTLPHAS